MCGRWFGTLGLRSCVERVCRGDDFRQGCNGFAIAHLNGDGWLDIVATFSPVRGQGRMWGKGERLCVWLGEGGFRFKEHAIKLLDSKVSLDSFGRGQVPNLADFDGDGFLDLFVTRHAPMTGGVNRRGIESVGNSLFVTDGAWDVFRDVSDKMGIPNEQAYNRQTSFGDVNGDGWLDIAIGCDNIKNAFGGVPHSRLYVFQLRAVSPSPDRDTNSSEGLSENDNQGDLTVGLIAGSGNPRRARFADGRFEDIGGTDLVPDFGGFYHDSAKDKAGPDIDLRDLDNDGDLDLVQSYHVDVREPLLDYWPGEYRQGVICWKNLLRETGSLRFEKVADNGLHCEARLRYSREKQLYEPASDARAPGLPYISLADVDHDGLMDVFAVGPNSAYWAPRVEDVSGRFWKNLGDFDNDGTFECRPTTFSGLDGSGITGEAADLNNDGLLDLFCAADPDNSGVALGMDRYESKVYWNTGEHGARQNHWLRLRFSGVTHAELIGACAEVSTEGMKQYRWIHSNHTYKSGGALESHFGPGKHGQVDLSVTLLDGDRAVFTAVRADQSAEVNLKDHEIREVVAPWEPRSSN